MKYKPEGLEANFRGGKWSELSPTKVERPAREAYKVKRFHRMTDGNDAFWHNRK